MAYVNFTDTQIFDTPATSITPTLPAHTTDDLLLICLTQDIGTTAISTATSGWAMIGTQAASGGVRQAWAYKVATSSSEPDPIFAGTLDTWIAQIVVVKDADITTPIHQNARGDWNNPAGGIIPFATATTSLDECLLLYSLGSDGVTPTMVPPNDLLLNSKQLGIGETSIVGWRNQYTAGVTPSFNALQSVATEGGNTWVLAIANKTGGGLAGECRQVCDVIGYGGNTASLLGFGTPAALSSVAASIGGVTCSATVPTIGSSTISDSSWGNSASVTTSTSTIPAYEGVVWSFAARDFSTATLNFLLSLVTAVTTARYARPFGVGMIIADSSGNWVAYQILTFAELRIRAYSISMQPNAGTVLGSSGTLDLTQITKIGFFTERSINTTSSAVYNIKNIVRQTGVTITGGAADAPAIPENVFSALVSSLDFAGAASFQGSGQFLAKQSVQVGDGTTETYANFSATSSELPRTQQSLFAPILGANFITYDNVADFVIRASASDTINFSSSIIACSNPQEFIVHASSSASADYNFTGCSIVGYAVTNNVAGIVFNGATFSGTRGITLNGGGMESCNVVNSVNTSAVTTNNPENIAGTTFTSAGTGHAIEITAPGSYDFSGNSFIGYGANGTTDAMIYNNSGGAVELIIPLADVTPTIRNGVGASTTITQPTNNQSVTLINGVNGSRVQIFDLTSNTELVNQVVATFPFTWTDPTPYVADREIRLRVAYQNGINASIFIDQIIGTATNASPDITFLLNQIVDTVYNINGIDGATVTDVTIDDALLLVEVDTGSVSWATIYAYETYWLFTEDGIRDESRFILAVDQANYRVFDFKIKNITSPSVPLVITGGYGVDGVTGQSIDIIDTTGGTIFNAPDHVVAFATGSGVTPGDKTDIAALVWDEAIAGHTTAGSTGKELTDAKKKAALAASLSA